MKKIFLSRVAIVAIVLSITAISSCTTDKCAEVSCQHYGTCEDGNCKCADGYEGSECQTKANTKFEGAYAGSLDCDFDIESVDITALNVSPRGIEIEFYNGTTGEVDFSLEAAVNGNNINISEQTVYVDGVPETYSGTGNLNGNTLTLNLTATDNGNEQDCFFTGNK